MLQKSKRSSIVGKIKAKNTGPERLVRAFLHSLDYRYRIHVASLPGRPDIVFPLRRKAIFINGCFWHGHFCAHGSIQSKTNTQFWHEKIEKNILRDKRVLAELEALGWKTLTLWECDLKRGQWIEVVIGFLEN